MWPARAQRIPRRLGAGCTAKVLSNPAFLEFDLKSWSYYKDENISVCNGFLSWNRNLALSDWGPSLWLGLLTADQSLLLQC